MRTIIYLLAFFFTLINTSGCKSSKGKKEENKETTTVTNKPSNLIVSFYSPGYGIDYTTATKFVAFLDSYIPKTSYTTIHWGREGETDYCIDLNGFTPKEQETFKEKATALVSKSDRVNILENEECREVRAED